MPSCQAYGCSQTTGKSGKGKSFFKVPEPKNEKERARAEKWLSCIGAGHEVRTFKFSKDKVLCEDHFHIDCIKKNMMNEVLKLPTKGTRKELVEGAIPSIFFYHTFEQINMDGTKAVLTVQGSENE